MGEEVVEETEVVEMILNDDGDDEDGEDDEHGEHGEHDEDDDELDEDNGETAIITHYGGAKKTKEELEEEARAKQQVRFYRCYHHVATTAGSTLRRP